MAAQVHAADQVGRVLSAIQRACAGGAALGQREHRRTVGGRLDPGVGVDGHEQVCVRGALLHAHVQRHEVVVVARQVGAHVRLAVDQRLEPARDAQHHVLSRRPLLPIAPGSSPPWPGSSAMVSMLAASGGRRLGRRIGGGAGRASGGSGGGLFLLPGLRWMSSRMRASGSSTSGPPCLLITAISGSCATGIQVQHQAVLIVGNAA